MHLKEELKDASAATTVGSLTPNVENCYSFSDFQEFLGPKTVKPIASPSSQCSFLDIHKNQKEGIMVPKVQTNQQKVKPVIQKKRSITNQYKVSRSLEPNEKINPKSLESQFLETFKKEHQFCSYNPDKFFDKSQMNNLHLNQIYPQFRRRVKVPSKSKYQDYRLKNRLQVEDYYKTLNETITKRTSPEKTNIKDEQIRKRRNSAYLTYKRDKKKELGNITSLKMGKEHQQRIINRFYEQKMFAKGIIPDLSSPLLRKND